jgi:hypothetical protein
MAVAVVVVAEVAEAEVVVPAEELEAQPTRSHPKQVHSLRNQFFVVRLPD